MLRRKVLKLSFGTAVGALGLRALAFEDKNVLPDLAGSFEAADRAGRPLLVFVIPIDAPSRRQHGVALGSFLNHGSDEDLAPLAMVDVVCAPLAAISAVVPKARLAEDALLVLIHSRKGEEAPEVSTFALEPAAADAGQPVEGDNRTHEQRVKENTERIEQRDSTIARFLWAELGPDRVKALASTVRPKLAAELRATLEDPVLDVGRLPATTLRAAAALLLERVTGSTGKDRVQIVSALAKEVRESIVKVPPAGAKWANSSGCGTTIEGEESGFQIACGMGMVPKQEWRFLSFLNGSATK